MSDLLYLYVTCSVYISRGLLFQEVYKNPFISASQEINFKPQHIHIVSRCVNDPGKRNISKRSTLSLFHLSGKHFNELYIMNRKTRS